MVGGLINIVSYGSQDIYLTGTPQITFFKVVYRRHTNFSVQSVELDFDDDVGFNTVSNKVLPPFGDLVNRVILRVDLPEISFNRIVLPGDVKRANEEFNIALNSFKNFVAFMTINSNAYRAAYEVYQAQNIAYSTEMVQSIKEVFASYTSDPYAAEVIAYYSNNTPIWWLQPITFNLLLIANSVQNPSSLDKDIFKRLIDNGIFNCGKIQEYYNTQLNVANENRIDTANRNLKFAWVDRVGHAIINYVDISIGGERIDRQYGEWINIWYELAGNKNAEKDYFKMIGNIPQLTTFDRAVKPAYQLFVPLQFWFNRFTGLALPLIALQYHECTITIKLRQFKQCAYIENLSQYDQRNPNYKESVNLDDWFEDNNYSLGLKLLVDYVYLDSLERRRFAQSSHEYMIEQLQVLDFYDIYQENIQMQLDFVNPCKEIIWIIQKDIYVNNDTGFNKCRWDNYSYSIDNKGLNTDFASLEFNGYERISRLSGEYFNYVQPYDVHTNTPSDGINVYSFAIRPEESQPSGACNFSRISKTYFNLWINPLMFLYYDEQTKLPLRTNVSIRIYATNMNVLRILSGMGATAYT